MKSMWQTTLLLAAGVAGVSWASAAQQQPAGMAPPPRVEAGVQRRKVSLKEAMQLAVKQGPDVAAARALADITRAGIRRAWTNWQPNIVATGTYDHTSAPSEIPAGSLGPGSPPITITAPNSRYGTLQITQPFLNPQGLFQPGIANSAAEAADRTAEQTREQIVLGVAQAYFTLQGLEGQIEAAREAERVALRREQDARARIAAGTDVEIALLRAQTETAQARSQIASLQGQKDSTLPQLEALVAQDRARLSQAQALLASARAQARSSWLGARANLDAQQAVLQQSVAQEQLAIRTQVQVEASYRAGVSTSLDLSVADQQKFAAQSTRAQSQAQLESRRAELAAAAGKRYA